MFDPFKDFEAQGYLRNTERLKDLKTIKVLENIFFQSNIEEALAYLSKVRGPLAHEHFKEVHRILFVGIYPWAGLDRHELGVAPLVSKGGHVQFVHSNEIRGSMEWAFRMGNDPQKMSRSPGEVMGAFAWAHPFLDGNGRTMLLVHSELCKRAGIRIDWLKTKKEDYLRALTAELLKPLDHALDKYLEPFVLSATKKTRLLDELKDLPGLDGLSEDAESPPEVAYNSDDQVALRAYLEIKRNRGGPK